MHHPGTVVSALLCLVFSLVLMACNNRPVDATNSGDGEGEAVGEATQPDAAEPAAEGEATADATAEGGKTANPGRPGPGEGPPKPMMTWDEAPLELDFPTGDAQVFFGQGMCMPKPACQDLKIIKGEKDKPLSTCADVAKIIPILEEKDQALARVRFCTDHRYVLSDESCHEIEVADDGTMKFTPPAELELDPEEPLTSAPVKVVDFEGGFRVERTLLCMGDETDKLVQVAETVFTEGHMEREEVLVLLEAPMLAPRLR